MEQGRRKIRKNLKRKEGKKNQKFKGKRTEKTRGLFFPSVHFQETTGTFKVSTKMEISKGKKLKSRREKIGKIDFAPPP